jgi:TetR/AcrR family transcriptional regulator, mexJK operon transcriptional repressor
MPRANSSTGRPPDPSKRAAILHSAQELFARDGFSATSMDAVARASGVAKLTAYRHFGSKDDLFTAAISARCDQMLARGDDVAADLSQPLASLIAFGKSFLSLIMHADALAIHRLIVAERDRAPQLGALFYSAAIMPTQRRLAELIDRLGLEVADSDQAAGDLLALWRARPMMQIEMGLMQMTAAERDAHIERVAALWLRAVR